MTATIKDPLVCLLLASIALVIVGSTAITGGGLDWLRDVGVFGLLLAVVGFAERMWNAWKARRVMRDSPPSAER